MSRNFKKGVVGQGSVVAKSRDQPSVTVTLQYASTGYDLDGGVHRVDSDNRQVLGTT